MQLVTGDSTLGLRAQFAESFRQQDDRAPDAKRDWLVDSVTSGTRLGSKRHSQALRSRRRERPERAAPPQAAANARRRPAAGRDTRKAPRRPDPQNDQRPRRRESRHRSRVPRPSTVVPDDKCDDSAAGSGWHGAKQRQREAQRTHAPPVGEAQGRTRLTAQAAANAATDTTSRICAL